MTPPRPLALAAAILALALAGCGKPSTSCSSEATKQALSAIIADGVKKSSEVYSLPGGAELLANVEVATTLDNIRTVSEADRAKSCRASADVHARYAGPQPEAPDEAKELAAVHEAAEEIMTAAGFTVAMKDAVRATRYYTAPSEAAHLAPGSALLEQGRAAIVVSAIAEKLQADQGLYAAQKTDVFKRIQQEDAANALRLHSIRRAMNEAANADQRARTHYSGDIDYAVELTDDGKPVVTIEPGN